MAEPIHTLVVDDEQKIRFFVEKTLRKVGHVVSTASSGEDALEHLREARFDLVIVDLNLGGQVDGLRVLEAVKWRWPETVVIILTGHGTLESALAAIREGVDGYLLKPAEAEEVRRAAQNALARRKRPPAPEPPAPVLQCGALTIDREKHVATLAGQPVALTPGEFNVLACLAQNAGRVVSAAELAQAAQGYSSAEREARELVKWYVHRLRHKIEPDPAHPQYIRNVRGVGYTFKTI